MGKDYRNLLITRNSVDWREIRMIGGDLHDVYEMKINHGYAYFVHTVNHHIFNQEYLHYYKPTVLLLYHEEYDAFVNLLDHTGKSVVEVDDIDSDFLYNNDDYSEYFIELLEPALLKVHKNMELSIEELTELYTVFKCFLYDYEDLPEDLKSKIIEV